VKTKVVGFILVVALMAIGLFGWTGLAWAETVHGGYSSLTNKCLSCHDIHTDANPLEPDSDYVLLRWPTVVDTCGSCHSLYLGSPGPDGLYGEYPYAAMFSGIGATASDRRAYKTNAINQDTHNGHRMLQGGDYIIGGSESLTALDIWNLGVPGGGNYSLWSPYNPDEPNTKSPAAFAATDGLYCASCHSLHADFGRQLDVVVGFNPDLKAGVHANKLLSSRPNHIVDDVLVNNWATDGYRFCLSCHNQRAPDHVKKWYNHPVEVCLICHADQRPAETYDFPHTGLPGLLAEEPDGLCVVCHTSGSLP